MQKHCIANIGRKSLASGSLKHLVAIPEQTPHLPNLDMVTSTFHKRDAGAHRRQYSNGALPDVRARCLHCLRWGIQQIVLSCDFVSYVDRLTPCRLRRRTASLRQSRELQNTGPPGVKEVCLSWRFVLLRGWHAQC